jgi:hypothetical protein
MYQFGELTSRNTGFSKIAVGVNQNRENMKVQKPNFSPVPNVIFDRWMAVLSNSEFKVLSCFFRSSLSDSDKDRTPSIIDIKRMTGLGKRTIKESVLTLMAHGLILKCK